MKQDIKLRVISFYACIFVSHAHKIHRVRYFFFQEQTTPISDFEIQPRFTRVTNLRLRFRFKSVYITFWTSQHNKNIVRSFTKYILGNSIFILSPSYTHPNETSFCRPYPYPSQRTYKQSWSNIKVPSIVKDAIYCTQYSVLHSCVITFKLKKHFPNANTLEQSDNALTTN